MGRSLYLQDDTFFQAQCRFVDGDGGFLLLFFLDEAILDVLEQGLDIDLSAFRLVADDTEGWLLDARTSEEVLRDELRALAEQMAAAWQPPATLAAAIAQVLAAIDRRQGVPSHIITSILALPIETTVDPEYYEAGELTRDMENLLAMMRHAVLRGATRVRLLMR